MIIILRRCPWNAAGGKPSAHPEGVLSGILQVLKGSQFNKKRYLEALKMMYGLFNKIRREGPNSVEGDIEAPARASFSPLSQLRQRS